MKPQILVESKLISLNDYMWNIVSISLFPYRTLTAGHYKSKGKTLII